MTQIIAAAAPGLGLVRTSRLKLPLAIIIAASIFVTSGCTLFDNTREYSSERFIMDTIVSIKVFSEDKDRAEGAIRSAFDEFNRLAVLSDRFPEKGTPAFDKSDVCKINDNAGIRPVKVDDDVFTMIELSKKYNEISEGAFDITIGPLADLWGFGGDNQEVPSDAKIRALLPLVGSDKVEIDPQEKTVYLKKEDMLIDLGAVAKGYAAEKAAEVLADKGISRAVVNAGGNICALGGKTDSKPWVIGIQDPLDASSLVGTVEVKDEAAVTSGDYQRFFEVEGVKYHHILDPSTGKPARASIGVTVINQSSAVADILSTALFVAGPEKGLKLAEELGNTDVLYITKDKTITMSPGMEAKVSLSSGNAFKFGRDK